MPKTHMPRELTGQAIDAMTPAQRQALVDEIERSTPEERHRQSVPPTPAERRQLERLAGRMGRANRPGRPKLGRKGTRVVSVTVEADLLERADAAASRAGLKRSELFSRALRQMLPA